MKGSELRIGNLFIEEYSSKIIEVIGLEKIKITFSGLFLDKWQAKPIALTEEWSLKFGFIKESDYFFIKINPFGTCIYLDIEENIYQIGCENGSWYSHNAGIKHVHQLQNLYFALSNEELTFKTK